MGVILGDGFLAETARDAFGEPPFTWVLDHPTLVEREYDGLVLISTPVPLGTIARLEAENRDATFAYLPENVRQPYAISDWREQVRHVLGVRHPDAARTIKDFFAPTPCLVMSPEEAELTKHAINGFLAVSIRYAHKIADLANRHGLNPHRVAEGVMSDPRIGEKAYLRPGGDVGPNLQREIENLRALGAPL